MKSLLNLLTTDNRVIVFNSNLAAMGVSARDVEVVNRLRYLNFLGYARAKHYLRRYLETRMAA
jgi:hypothetical protein